MNRRSVWPSPAARREEAAVGVDVLPGDLARDGVVEVHRIPDNIITAHGKPRRLLHHGLHAQRGEDVAFHKKVAEPPRHPRVGMNNCI